jgi:Leucine Rich repeat
MNFKEFIVHELYSLLSHEDMNSFSLTTRSLKKYKKYYYHIELNKIHSLKYCEDKIFEETIHSHIQRPLQQLSLRLQYTEMTDEIVQNLGNCHTLNFSFCDLITDKGIRNLGKCYTLKLGWCNKITDEGIKHLGKCHTIDSRWCNKITQGTS